MENLITITTSPDGKRVVSARELYEALGFNPTHWAKWSKKNITDNPFALEGTDYQPLALSASDNSKGNFAQDFAISLNFAKKLSMLARTPKGNEIRDYFIVMEQVALKEKLLTPNDLLNPDFIIQLATQLKSTQIAKAKLQLTNMEMKPKVEYYDRVLQDETLITTTVIAKELGLSAKTLNRRLHLMGIIYHVGGKKNGTWVLYAKYQNMGYTGTKTFLHTSQDGREATSIDLYWTQKGREFIFKIMGKTLSLQLTG